MKTKFNTNNPLFLNLNQRLLYIDTIPPLCYNEDNDQRRCVMNEVIRTIQNRFSCRRFLSRPVPDEVLSQIVEAAKYAPNGKNAQAWHFTIIRTEEGRAMLRDAAGKTPPPGFPQGKNVAAPGMPEQIMRWPFQGDFCGAPAIILISGAPDTPWPEIGPVLAAENLMLAAASLGLATLWSTVFTKDLFRDAESMALKPKLIPEGYDLKAAIFVGYPERIPKTRPKRKENVETWL